MSGGVERPTSDVGTRASFLVRRLIDRGETLSVAESCTGGWLGQAITAVPGASSCFRGGVIAYDDAVKRRVLGVSSGVLEVHGAVSAQTAEAMARGAGRLFACTWSVAITGIAGPGGGSPEKPVGTVCIAAHGPASVGRTFVFGGDREAVRRSAVAAALDLLREALDAP